MKPRCLGKGNRALTLFEVLLIIAIVMILAMLLLPNLTSHSHCSTRISCVNNLKQVGLAFRVWEGDNNEKYPMQVSVTNGGSMELATHGGDFVRLSFLTMTNELSTPKILYCPADIHGSIAVDFSPSFANSNISYFISPDGADRYPQMILSGDDNLAVNGNVVKPGILNLSTNDSIAWTTDRHVKVGNIGMGDGSAQQVTIPGLQQALQQTSFGTNRIAIP